jgi:HAMP domain-containing protein
MDNVRDRMAKFEAQEKAVRKELRQRLDQSVARAEWLSAGLAVAALALGLVWSIYLVRMFSRRLRGMLELAQRLAGGDYDIQIVDHEQDEVSELTTALNGLCSVARFESTAAGH